MASLTGWGCLALTLTVTTITTLLPGCAGQAAGDLEDRVERLSQALNTLTREIMSQQFGAEEHARNSGNSGIMRIKGNRVKGTKSYYTSSYVSPVAGIHDHGNNIRTCGMGEVVAVLNGVEFRTRHNDFRLVMKSTTSGALGAAQDIPFPDVPPEVLAQATVAEQVQEMQLWFKAWGEQDHAVRDYRPYFQPVLCYMEGAWTYTGDHIEELFFSDRHQLDATTWTELEEKINFCAMTGREDEGENLAYLPRKTVALDPETGIPIQARWNYQILCHPVSSDIPTNRFRLVDDMKSRMLLSVHLGRNATEGDLAQTRSARYQLNTRNVSEWQEDGRRKYSFLDQLMYEVPGMNNYGGHLVDDAFGLRAQHYEDGTDLNTANHHRVFKVDNFGAMGTRGRSRSFGDPNLFMAMNTQPEIANATTGAFTQKWSMSIPLEIIYMTPLSQWNPYGIPYRGNRGSRSGNTVTAGPNGQTRDGSSDPDGAYNGTSSTLYYQTPCEFYSGALDSTTDPADTTGTCVHVLDAAANVVSVGATGHRIFLPEIPGVGVLRQRYPITPIYAEGSAAWMELEAVKDAALEPVKHEGMFRGPQAAAELRGSCARHDIPLILYNVEDEAIKALEDEMTMGNFHVVTLHMAPANDDVTHIHGLILSAADMQTLCWGGQVVLHSLAEDGHAHEVLVRKVIVPMSDAGAIRIKYIMTMCDGNANCALSTGHNRRLFLVEPEE